MRNGFLILVMVLPGRAVCQLAPTTTHDPELRAVDLKWRPRFEALVRGQKLGPTEVNEATRAAMKPKASKTTVYRAILIRDASAMESKDEDPLGSEKIKKLWIALKLPTSYESKKATLLCESSRWGSKETVSISDELFGLDEKDLQVILKAGYNLMGYSSVLAGGVDIDRRVSAVLEKICAAPDTPGHFRDVLALCYIGLANRRNQDRNKYLKLVKEQYQLCLKAPGLTPRRIRYCKYQIQQVEIALAQGAPGGG